MKKYHTKSFLKVILIRKGRKRDFSLSICILNRKNIIKKKLGFFSYKKFNPLNYLNLSNGRSTLFFIDYFFYKKWIVKSLKFTYKTSLFFKILNLI